MDRLRLGIAETDADGGDDFQVLIYVNDVEMTAIGAGLGMDPYDVLVPDNCSSPGTSRTRARWRAAPAASMAAG